MATATASGQAATGYGTGMYFNKFTMVYDTTTGLVSTLAVTNNSPRASVLTFNTGTVKVPVYQTVTIPAGAVSETISITGWLATVDMLTTGLGMGGP